MLGFGQKPEEKKEQGSLMQSSASAQQQHSNAQADSVLPLSKAPDIHYYKPVNDRYPEIARAPRIPKSCLSSKSNGCVCYDQYLNRINDFPEKRCRDIVSGTDQLAFTRDKQFLN